MMKIGRNALGIASGYRNRAAGSNKVQITGNLKYYAEYIFCSSALFLKQNIFSLYFLQTQYLQTASKYIIIILRMWSLNNK